MQVEPRVDRDFMNRLPKLEQFLLQALLPGLRTVTCVPPELIHLHAACLVVGLRAREWEGGTLKGWAYWMLYPLLCLQRPERAGRRARARGLEVQAVAECLGRAAAELAR